MTDIAASRDPSVGLHQALRFAVVGGLSTCLYGILIFVGLSIFGWSAAVASVFAIALATGANYVLQRAWTFKSSVSVRRSLHKFLLVHGLAAVLNTGALWLLVDSGAMGYGPGQAIGVVLYITWSFVAQKFWVFR
jgi:putative flippase GtrA